MKLEQRTKRTLVRWIKKKDTKNWQDIYVRALEEISEGLDESQFNRVVKKSLNDGACTSIPKWRQLMRMFKDKIIN